MTESRLPHVIEFENVSKVFNPGTPREFCAIKDVSFVIEDLVGVGEIRAILGPSGCGKSTVLNLISGFDTVFPPTTGTIKIRGKSIDGPGIDRGMVFQKYSSFPHLTVFQNVKFGLEINREMLGLDQSQINTRAKEWIEKVGLGGHENKYAHQLSGGQQQRVALARTLVLKPRIILMDEPFSALDEPTRLDMQKLLIDLWNEVEATVLMVTHSIIEAVYLGDCVWIFSKAPGNIVRTFDNMPLPPKDIHPLEVQRSPEFLKYVEDVSCAFREVETGSGIRDEKTVSKKQ